MNTQLVLLDNCRYGSSWNKPNESNFSAESFIISNFITFWLCNCFICHVICIFHDIRNECQLYMILISLIVSFDSRFTAFRIIFDSGVVVFLWSFIIMDYGSKSFDTQRTDGGERMLIVLCAFCRFFVLVICICDVVCYFNKCCSLANNH